MHGHALVVEQQTEILRGPSTIVNGGVLRPGGIRLAKNGRLGPVSKHLMAVARSSRVAPKRRVARRRALGQGRGKSLRGLHHVCTGSGAGSNLQCIVGGEEARQECAGKRRGEREHR